MQAEGESNKAARSVEERWVSGVERMTAKEGGLRLGSGG